MPTCLGILVLMLSMGSLAVRAEAPITADTTDEVTVIGERPGPEMWKLTKADRVLWVLGTLDPLPKRMRWRSAQVEAAIARSEIVFPARRSLRVSAGPWALFKLYRQWRRTEELPKSETLAALLPAALAQRFAALKVRYAPTDRRLEHLRPMFAAERLYLAALERSDLRTADDIGQSVIRVARKHKIAVREDMLTVSDPQALMADLRAIPRAAEIACLETTIARLEVDLVPMRSRAAAWAVGDVERLRKLPYPDQDAACWQAIEQAATLRDLTDHDRVQRIAAIEAAFSNAHTMFALFPIGELLDPNGVLARFRNAGFEVAGP
jgi:uncharacterized protein YbaP (TraB family)